jgi:hypothetical protein
MANKTPKISHINTFAEKSPKVQSDPAAYKHSFVSWQIGLIDYDGPWGFSQYREEVKFSASDELMQTVYADNELFILLDELDKKTYSSCESFFNRLINSYKKPLNPDIARQLHACLVRWFFDEKILPKLKGYESKNWHEIEAETYSTKNERKSRHHTIPVGKLSKEAQRRLRELNMEDIEELFSFRLEGLIRVWGIRKFGYFQLLWIDPDHTVYPV